MPSHRRLGRRRRSCGLWARKRAGPGGGGGGGGGGDGHRARVPSQLCWLFLGSIVRAVYTYV